MGMWGWLSPEDVEPIGEQFGERLGGPYWITGLTPEVCQVVSGRQCVWMVRPEDAEPIGEQFGERLGGPYWITGLTPEVREVVTCRQRVWMVRPRHD